MKLHHSELILKTSPKSITNITKKLQIQCQALDIESGLCHLFVKHTSCSLLISENCDPDVLLDLETFMSNLVPESGQYRHDAEGADDMPAHIRSILTQTSLTVPVSNGQLALGQWQAVYLWEHRSMPHQRQLLVSFYGL